MEVETLYDNGGVLITTERLERREIWHVVSRVNGELHDACDSDARSGV